MRHWLVVGLLATTAMACSGNDDGGNQQNSDSDDHGDQDTIRETATCEEFFARTIDCFADAGCPAMFEESQFVSSCKTNGSTPRERGALVSLSCEENIGFFCELSTQGAGNPALFSSPCCQEFFSCPSTLLCDELEDGVGLCLTQAQDFPSGAPSCNGAGSCNASGFICHTIGAQSKCVQVCVTGS